MGKSCNKCLSCGNSMRSWHTSDFESPTHKEENIMTGLIEDVHETKYVAMCITDGCIEQGKVYRALEYVPDIKIELKLPGEL